MVYPTIKCGEWPEMPKKWKKWYTLSYQSAQISKLLNFLQLLKRILRAFSFQGGHGLDHFASEPFINLILFIYPVYYPSWQRMHSNSYRWVCNKNEGKVWKFFHCSAAVSTTHLPACLSSKLETLRQQQEWTHPSQLLLYAIQLRPDSHARYSRRTLSLSWNVALTKQKQPKITPSRSIAMCLI